MSFARNSRLRSLSFRLTVWYFLVFLASTLLLAAAAEFRIRSSIRERIVDTLTTSLNLHKQTFEEQGIEGLKKLTEATEKHAPVAVTFAWSITPTSRSSRVRMANCPSPPPRFAVTASSQRVRPVRAQNDGSLWNMGTMPLSEGRWLQLAISDEQTQEVVGHLRAGLVAVWIGAVALGLLGGFLLTNRALRPVQRLASTAQKVIESGDLALRVPERGKPRRARRTVAPVQWSSGAQSGAGARDA